MLPSMPLLFSGSCDSYAPAENNIQTKDSSQLSLKENKPFISDSESHELLGFSFGSIPEDEKECDDELVLLAENSSIGEKRKAPTQTTPRKKKKIEAVKPFLENRVDNDEQANHFATSYFMKAKAELDEATFLKFIALLSDVEETKTDVISLYRKILDLLSNYPNLAEEFIGFLHPHQALDVGEFTNYIQFERSWNFFRKIDAFHLNKVYHLLEQHMSNPSVTNEAVKNSLLSAFKGHPNITEGLLFLLPDEKPPASHKEDYDDISDLGIDETCTFEKITIPEQPNKGCSPDVCDCACHLCVPRKFCTFCNIKFSNGQIYVQTGKGLKFAKVTFEEYQQEEVLWRLNPSIYSKPAERKRTNSTSHNIKVSEPSQTSDSPTKCEMIADGTKDVSKYKSEPTKDAVPESLEELLDDEPVEPVLPPVKNEEVIDDETINDIQMSESGTEAEEIADASDPKEECIDETGLAEEVNNFKSENIKIIENEVVDSKEQPEELYDEPLQEIKSEKSEEEILKTLPEVINAEKNEEINIKSEDIKDECNRLETDELKKDEINRDRNKIMESDKREERISGIDNSEKERKEAMTRMWTREEDKLILQAFQRQLGTDQTFSRISDLLPNRSVDDIQGRFQVLMNLLEQMTSGSNYPS